MAGEENICLFMSSTYVKDKKGGSRSKVSYGGGGQKKIKEQIGEEKRFQKGQK